MPDSIDGYAGAPADYEALFPELRQEIHFLFEYAKSLRAVQRYEESNRILRQAMSVSCDPALYNMAGQNCRLIKDDAEAERYFLQSSCLVPSRLLPYYLLAKLYDETDRREQALAMAEIVLTRKPKVHSQAVDEMREEMEKLKNKILIDKHNETVH
jgi:tetratricopeptide (TPR) repeat protein